MANGSSSLVELEIVGWSKPIMQYSTRTPYCSIGLSLPIYSTYCSLHHQQEVPAHTVQYLILNNDDKMTFKIKNKWLEKFC